MIPVKYLSKMGKYVVEIQGDEVEASVTDNEKVVDVKIAELKASIQGHDRLVVGVDVKYRIDQSLFRTPSLLILSWKNRCLIVQICRLNMLPDSVSDFLADETICFVHKGADENLKRDDVNHHWMVLKKPNLSTCGLADLAREVGIDAEASSSSTGSSSAPGSSNAYNWKSIAFTDQQIKDAIQDAYTTYLVGDKLLEMELMKITSVTMFMTIGLTPLLREVGIDAEASSNTGSSSAPGSSNAPKWETIVFTDQQINDAIQNAHTTYNLVGDKLFAIPLPLSNPLEAVISCISVYFIPWCLRDFVVVLVAVVIFATK
ncbi:hypothetical protein ACOSQ4_008891 [Xanthoceras sorbifolium]